MVDFHSLDGFECVAGVHCLAQQIVAGISIGTGELASAENRTLFLHIEEYDNCRLWEEVFDLANLADWLIE